MAGEFRRRGVVAVAVGLTLAGIAAGQPGAVAPPPPRTLTPVQALVQPPQISPGPAGAPPAEVTLTQPVLSDGQLPPLPGSVEDRYQQELAARESFTSGTWRGTAVTAFPNSLLWEPPLAVKKDPRMQLIATSQDNYRSGWTLDTSIGMTMGLLRLEPEGADFAAQLDIFGLVLTRLSPDDLIAADYRFGFPVSFKWGWWQAKVAYEHTSAHLGDEFIRQFGTPIPSFAKDELVVGLGRFVGDNLRVYGHAGYAFNFQVPGVADTTDKRWRFDAGAEWFLRCPTGWAGTPFAAANVEWRGDQNYDPNYTVQAGWFWRNPTQRLGTLRVFAEYYNGRSPYGQFLQNRETFTSVGFGFDY